MDWEIGNYAFGASAGHPFLGAVIENCVKAQTNPQWVMPMMNGVPYLSREEYVVLSSTGPGLLSRTLAENPTLSKCVTILLPDDVCDLDNWNCFGDFGVHLMEGTWRLDAGNVKRRLRSFSETRREKKVLEESRRISGVRDHDPKINWSSKRRSSSSLKKDGPLVSILIPAYNAEESIAATLRSAVAQSWEPKEIIVVDDGSTDNTVAIARQFEACGVRIATQSNQGAAAARNHALSLSRGDYIQWLDADDLLSTDKISRQIEALGSDLNPRILLSAAWAHFLYRHYKAAFVPSELWSDLSPTEWLLRKLDHNVYMQTATWLVSRELTEAAGLWDTRLLSDDDGEYFCRVLLASEGVRFVPGAKVFYRSPGLAFSGLSYVDHTDTKLTAHWLSMQLHVEYLRSLEESERVKAACVNYLQTSMIYFYPERQDLVARAHKLANELGGELGPPDLSWKYRWIKVLFGWRSSKVGRQLLLKFRWSLTKSWDKLMFRLFDRDLVENQQYKRTQGKSRSARQGNSGLMGSERHLFSNLDQKHHE
jgi:glycosyltransferase involved in cell wall biosynthesis